MWQSLQVRIAIYLFSLVVGAGSLAAGFGMLWQRLAYWEKQLNLLQVETLQWAEISKASFLDLNAKLLRYELSRVPEDRLQFEMSAVEVGQWLGRSAAEVSVQESRLIFDQLSAGFGRYLIKAQDFLDNLPPAEAIQPTNALLARVDQEAQRFLALDNHIAEIQRAALRSLRTRARLDIDQFQAVLYALMVVMLGGLAILALVVYRDLIVPLKKRVIESRALLERQEKLGALGMMTAGLAHEIRNPLNSIKARLFTQRRVLGDQSPGLEDNRFIDEEIDRLEGIVQQALQFGRPAEPMPETLRVGPFLDGLAEMVRPGLEKLGIRLRRETALDAAISVDPTQMRQALLNLIRNASESIGRDGEIVLEARPGRFQGKDARRPAVALEVRDNGPGLTPEARRRLFDPFFTTKDNGTGLGLSITAQIVYRHGGQIECQSQPGQGAVFAIILPIVSSHETDPPIAD